MKFLFLIKEGEDNHDGEEKKEEVVISLSFSIQ